MLILHRDAMSRLLSLVPERQESYDYSVLPILTTSLIHCSLEGWENVL